MGKSSLNRLSKPATLCAAFQETAARFPDRVALRTPRDTVRITWRAYTERVRRIAEGLHSLGVRRGDAVGIMLTNRPEFHLVDTGAMHAGATAFSIYNSLVPEQIAYLFGNARNRVVVCERAFLPQVRAAAAIVEQIEHIVCVGETVAPDGTMTLEDLESRRSPEFDFEASWRAVEPSDVVTIIYTSGTTGAPKGVELTHANMLAELDAVSKLADVDHDDRVVSYLPDAHIANRWGAHYSNLARGMQVTTIANIKETISALPETRPTFFGAVPQIWYKLKAAIDAAIAAEKSPIKKRLALWAIDVGTRHAWLKSERRPIPRSLELQRRVADKLVLGKMRAKLGLDQVRFAASGAAPIAKDVLAFVLGIGIPVVELWGMSELSCAVTVNPPGAIRIGTVGVCLEGTEIKLADDGELLVRGPLVMKGYRNDPERTAETIDPDGWLHTGDIATIDADGYVTIVDRKKELIINSAGKNMSPSNIEGAVRAACPLVGSVVAIGDNRPYIVALVTLDSDGSKAYAAKRGLSDGSTVALATDGELLREIEAGIAVANAKLSRVEQIKRFKILPAVWEPGGEEITPTMKLKRKPIAQKYAAEIESLYESSSRD